jgi:hypothetical protein
MKRWTTWLGAVLLAGSVGGAGAQAQTDGGARLEVTLLDYNGSSTKHYTVVWVTTGSGTFIKSLRKQGPSSWTSKEWNSHCQTWNTARASSTVLDGYTSATAANYTGTNSPVVCTWNGRDAAGNVMPDGPYKFWIQYAEDNGQGPFTTSGLAWTKGAAGVTNSYANQGANFSGMKVVWLPSAPATVAPQITSAAPPAAATVGVPYTFTSVATGTAPITFTASGLPDGLQMNAAGALSGTPLATGNFAGTITAANGTLPNATQPFSIVVGAVPVSLGSIRRDGASMVLEAAGPPNGRYAVLGSTEPIRPAAGTPPLATGTFDTQGHLVYTNLTDPGVMQWFYWLRVP